MFVFFILSETYPFLELFNYPVKERIFRVVNRNFRNEKVLTDDWFPSIVVYGRWSTFQSVKF